jgi:hypothetical protein
MLEPSKDIIEMLIKAQNMEKRSRFTDEDEIHNIKRSELWSALYSAAKEIAKDIKKGTGHMGILQKDLDESDIMEYWKLFKPVYDRKQGEFIETNIMCERDGVYMEYNDPMVFVPMGTDGEIEEWQGHDVVTTEERDLVKMSYKDEFYQPYWSDMDFRADANGNPYHNEEEFDGGYEFSGSGICWEYRNATEHKELQEYLAEKGA